MDVSRVQPFGTKVLLKRPPVETETQFGGLKLQIPEAYRDRKEGKLFSGVVIAVGDKTKAARFGHLSGHFEPGDLVHLWSYWDWKDREVVIEDRDTGGEYLLVDEGDVRAYEVLS